MAIKFALKLKGVYVRSIERLRECFSEDEILEVYKDKRLLTWLDVWEYFDLKKEVESISELDDSKIISKLYDIFEIKSYSSENIEEYFESALNYYYISDYEKSLKSFQEYFRLDDSNTYSLEDCKEKIKYYEDIIEELLIKIIEKNNNNNLVQPIKSNIVEDTQGEQVQTTETSHQDEQVQTTEASHQDEQVQTTETSHQSEQVQTTEASHQDEQVQTTEASHQGEQVQTTEASHQGEQVQTTEASHQGEQVQTLEMSQEDIIQAQIQAELDANYKIKELNLNNNNSNNNSLEEDDDFIQALEKPEQYLLLKEGYKQLEEEMKAIKIQEVEKTKKPNIPRAFNRNDALNFINSAKVVIPEGFNAIDEEAFYENSTILREIIMPNTITSIGDYAFKWCKNLIDIVIPTSVIYIGSCAFYGCINLIKMTLSEGITYIGDEAFSYCNNLQEIVIPDSVTYIGNEAFYECSKLKKVTISRNTKIEETTFNTAITKIMYKY